MKTLLVTAITALTMLISSQPVEAQSGHDLFQQALVKERASGELREAIGLYERIVEEFSADRELVARALVQMGQCYERLGLTDAREVYRRVIDDFPEQRGEVATARQRLASLTQELAELNREPTFRKIEIASKPQNGVLSPDGTTLAFASGGSLWLVPIHGRVDPYIAGEPVRLTEPMGVRGITNIGNSLAWSGNGEWIAFNALPDEGPRGIHLISSSGGEIKKVPGIPWEGGSLSQGQISLSTEGRTLAFIHSDSLGRPGGFSGERPTVLLYTMSVEGGEAVRLASPQTEVAFEEMAPAYSPDGRFLAFARQVEVDDPETPSYQQWIVPVDGETPIMVADSIRVRYPPVWAPDSRQLAFIRESDPGDVGGQEVWVVPIAEDGQPEGEPRAFSLPQIAMVISGWTPEDELAVFMYNETRQAVYTVPVEGGRAVQITPNGMVFHPRWARDGSAIVFRGVDPWLATVPAKGGESTEIEIVSDPQVIPAIPGGGLHVSPDGRKILFSGAEIGVRPLGVDIWTVPVGGGAPTRITDSPSQDRFPCWFPDGHSVAFLRYRQMSEGEFVHNLFLAPLAGGEPRRITVDADSVAYAAFAFSPDGEWLAYFSNGAVKIRPAEGGEARVVVRPEGVGSHSELAWSPDGQRIAYTGRGSIWITSIDGGEPVEVMTGVLSEDAENLHIDWSPDGEKIVFSASTGGEAELWLISDFLP